MENEYNSSESCKQRSIGGWLLVAICFLGLTINGYQVTSSYLAYGVSTQAWFYSLEDIKPPLITLCIPSPDIRNNCSRARDCFNNSKDFFENKFRLSEIVSSVQFLFPGKQEMIVVDTKHFEVSNTQIFIIYDQLCYQFNISVVNNQNIVYSQSFAQSLKYRGMLVISLNCSDCLQEASRCEISIGAKASQVYQVKERLINIFDYREKELHLLPKPYVTKCRDYSGEQLTSRGPCFRKCV